MLELRNIQALRAFAAMLVVWAHLREMFPTSPLMAALPSGLAGVDLFFVISGFIMVASTGARPVTPPAFIARRYLRVAPLYYLFTVLVFGLAVALPSAFKSTSSDWSSLLQSLAFIPFEKTAGRIYPVYYLGWTLNYEMFFYLLFALAIWISAARRGLVVAGLVALLAVSGLFIPFSDAWVPAFAFTRPIMLDFVMGALIGVALPQLTSLGKRLPVVAVLTLAVGVVAIFGLVHILPTAEATAQINPVTDTVIRYGIPAAIIVASLVALEATGRAIPDGPIVFLGDASYSLYLSHFIVVSVAIAAANRLGLHSALLVGLAVVTFFVCLGIASGVHLFIERPMLALSRRLTRPKRPVVVEAA